MKKILIASVAALALILGSAASANAQSAYQFSNYLTIGSTGSDVSALQTWLISKGFQIPAISSGAAQTGYFGQQTKSAVMQYQASVGVPNTGFVGPLTIAKLNAGAGVVVTTPVTCPIGYTCTANPGTVTTPVTTTPGSITTPGVAGSLALSLQSTPSNGTSVDKGQSADVVRYKLQAGDSDMLVQSLSLDFDVRLWLYASSITLKDDAGAVIGQVNNLNQNNFTELTVGTQYRLRIPVNYVVPRGATRYVTANISLLPVTDRDSATISITRAETRAVDGTGVTDTQSITSTRTFSYTGTNNGQVVATLSATAPLQKLVQISTSAETNDVVLAKYDLKSQNKDGTLRTFKIAVNTLGQGVTTLFSDIRLQANGQTYSADSVASSTSFTNLSIPLPRDQYVTVTILGKVARDTDNFLDGASASTTLTANGTNIVVEDSTYDVVDINSTTISSSEQTFSASSAVLSSATSQTPTAVTNPSTGSTTYNIGFTFSLTAGDNTLYVSKQVSANSLVSTSTTGSGISAKLVTVTANPDTLSGDSTTEYTIPAGSSRTFTVSGSATGSSGAVGTVKITAVKYGVTSGAYNKSIDYNIGSLQTQPALAGLNSLSRYWLCGTSVATWC